jgi:hypothetical protein
MASRFGIGAISVAKWEVDDGFSPLKRPKNRAAPGFERDPRIA